MRRTTRSFHVWADNEEKLFRFLPWGTDSILSYSLQWRLAIIRRARRRMSNDLPVIQIVAIHLQPIGDSVLVPIKRTQVQISGWTVLRRHPMGVRPRYIPKRPIDTTIFRSCIISHGALAKKTGPACVRLQRGIITKRIDVYVVISGDHLTGRHS